MNVSNDDHDYLVVADEADLGRGRARSDIVSDTSKSSWRPDLEEGVGLDIPASETAAGVICTTRRKPHRSCSDGRAGSSDRFWRQAAAGGGREGSAASRLRSPCHGMLPWGIASDCRTHVLDLSTKLKPTVQLAY
jgi:hypothetical protein